MLERTIKVLFRTRDISAVKRYLVTQWAEMLSSPTGLAASLNLVDYMFAKEYKGKRGDAYKKAAVVGARAVRDSGAAPWPGD